MLYEEFVKIGEFAAAGAFEQPNRGLFYRKALGIRRYYENCKLIEYDKNKFLYPSGQQQDDMIVKPYYLEGMNIGWHKVTEENANLIKEYQKEFLGFVSKLPEEHTVAGNMWCHSVPNYARVINQGFNSYEKRINNIEDVDLREGLLHIYEGVKCYVQR